MSCGIFLIAVILSMLLLNSCLERKLVTTTTSSFVRAFASTTSSRPTLLLSRTTGTAISNTGKYHSSLELPVRLQWKSSRVTSKYLFERQQVQHDPGRMHLCTQDDDTSNHNNDENHAAVNGYGYDMDQKTLMETDMLVAVDEMDQLVPNAVLSKRLGHTFTSTTPRATLHRAFSFFLFNSENQLLLTQRAASKITFPNVWTNTVCSHPLYGMTPNEADIVPDAFPHFPGIKHAAIRKCQHELGIPQQCIPHEQIQFVSRFHYWAADTITYGKDSPWGEHEVDYILFMKLHKKTSSSSSSNDDDGAIPISAHPEEVSNYKYVSMTELRTMLQDPTLLWSPWFIGIMERGGWDWWANLDATMEGKYTNDDITYFDPPQHHMANYNLPAHTKYTGVWNNKGAL
jgi:isopentenyl-diphosphate Delta-isomerase